MRIFVLTGAVGLLAACTTGPVTVPRDAVLYEVPRTPAPAPQVASRQVAPAMPPAPAADPLVSRIERVLEPAPAAGGALPRVDLPPVEMADGDWNAAPAEDWASAPQDWDAPPQDWSAAPSAAEGAPTLPAPGLRPEAPAVAGTGAGLDDDRLNLNEYTLEQQRIDAAIAERELEAARQQLVIVEPGASVPQAANSGVNIALFAKQTSHAVGERRYARPVTAALNRGGACRRFASADEAQRFFLANGGPERDPHGLDPDGDGFACGWNPEPFRRLGS